MARVHERVGKLVHFQSPKAADSVAICRELYRDAVLLASCGDIFSEVQAGHRTSDFGRDM